MPEDISDLLVGGELMSADNFVGVRPNKDGTYSIFEYGNMSMFEEDCMYLADKTEVVMPDRATALVFAHDLVKGMYVCEYGVIEMKPVPEEPCGQCYICTHERQKPAGLAELL
jgi:hypothetical protein